MVVEKKNSLQSLINNKKYYYPLLKDGFSKEDIQAGINILKSRQLTMSKQTYLFEKIFAKRLGIKYSLMVNSGSSANLLATFASCNPLRKNNFKRGDTAIIQSLCWSTSLWPLVQSGLKIKFVDINHKTLNVDAKKLINHVTRKTKVIMIVNVLGLSPDIEKIRKYCLKKKNYSYRG